MRPKIFVLLFVPLVISLLCWLVIFWFFWTTWVLNLTHLMQDTWLITTLQGWLSADTSGILGWLSVVFLILLFLPLTYLTATLLTSIFVMPLMVNLVVKQDYPHLEQKRGGTMIGSIFNSLRIGVAYVAAIVLTIPLWLIPGGAIAVPLFLGSWMNNKIFSYDSLQDFASKTEFRHLVLKERRGLYSLGLVLGFLNYLPLVSFVLPVVMGLAYSHFCLSALHRQRLAGGSLSLSQ